MEKRTIYQRVAEAQQRLKESPAFLLVATIILVGDIGGHFRYGWDPDWGATNLALSIEALYNGIFVLMAFAVSAKLAKEFHTWLKRQIVEVRKLLDRLEAIFEVLRLILEHMDEIRELLRAVRTYMRTNESGAT